MNAYNNSDAVKEVIESEFKDLLGSELFAVYHSDITSLADWFSRTMKCVYENEEGQPHRPQIKERG